MSLSMNKTSDQKPVSPQAELASFSVQEKSTPPLLACFPLSKQEEDINNVLEELGGFNIKGRQTPKWLEWGFAGSVLLVSLGIGTSLIWLSLLNPNLVGAGGIRVVAIGLGSLLSLGVIHAWFVPKILKRMRLPNVEKLVVHERQHLLKKAIRFVSSPLLKGRLAEVYLLADNKDIDVRFWIKLEKELVRCVNQHQREEDDEFSTHIKKVRDDYRKIISNKK